ncbi:MAG: chromosomal replication initiator protein DnaA [Minisyncoccia bacterium]
MNTKELWQAALAEIELSLSRANYSTWFKSTTIVKFDDGTVYIGVPNEFVKDWLITKYHSFILKTLRDLNNHVRTVEYCITKTTSEPRKEVEVGPSEKQPFSRLPFHETREDGLNPKYTFQNFIVGPFNELAYAAAQAIINHPGAQYNPLFIYGGTGLGKTHLLQSMGNEIKRRFSDYKVFYTSLEKFSVDYVNSMHANKINGFKDKYRKYDVLIMDDIQFVSGKEKTQEQLFYLFNTLHEQNKQIIFSSDKHPNFILGLEDRLQSRFNAGMIIDIMQPDFESRFAIVRSKVKESTSFISDEILEYVAESVQGSIRELEGVLNTVIMQSQLKGRVMQLQEVKQLIKNNIKTKKNISLRDVIKVVSDFYGIDDTSIYNKTRRKDIVKPRQVAMYILREDFDISYPAIGDTLGGRDHTTVIHSYEKIKKDLTSDPVLMKEVAELRSLFT